MPARSALSPGGGSQLFFDGEKIGFLFFLILFLFALPPSLMIRLDRRQAAKLGERWNDHWLAKVIHRTLRAYQVLTMGPLFSQIQLTLFTNTPRKRSYPLSAVVVVGLFGFLFLHDVTLLSGQLPIHDYRYFPAEPGTAVVAGKHYESLRPRARSARAVPTIHADVIDGPFVKLFIPYTPRRHNELLAERCPGVEPISAGFLARDREEAIPARVTAALSCLAGLHEVELNGSLLDLEFDYYARSEADARGFVTYIPTAPLPRGRNLLRIAEVEATNSSEEAVQDAPDDEESAREYFIPFWICCDSAVREAVYELQARPGLVDGAHLDVLQAAGESPAALTTLPSTSVATLAAFLGQEIHRMPSDASSPLRPGSSRSRIAFSAVKKCRKPAGPRRGNPSTTSAPSGRGASSSR